MKKMTVIIGIFFLLISCAKKGEKIGDPVTILMVQGDVSVKHGDAAREPAQAGMRLYVTDSVITGKEAMAVIISGESRLELSANTTLAMVTVENASSDKAHSEEFFMESGAVKIFAKLNRLRKDRLEVRSNTVLAAVRGTVFSVAENEDTSRVECNQGSIVIKDPQGKRPPVVLKEGSFLSIDVKTGVVTRGSIDEKHQPKAPHKKRGVPIKASGYSHKPATTIPPAQ
jgi:hypothetical protein